MCIHVDDFYVVASHKDLLDTLYNSLTRAYGSVSINEGDLLSYLGMQLSVDSDTGNILLSQPGYANQLCDMYLDVNRTVTHTPLALSPTPKAIWQLILDQIYHIHCPTSRLLVHPLHLKTGVR